MPGSNLFMAEHKKLVAIANTTTFTARGAVPLIVPLDLMAAITESDNYPRARITLCSVIGTISLTAHQAAALRDALDQAIAEVVASCPAMSTPDDFETLPKEMPRG